MTPKQIRKESNVSGTNRIGMGDALYIIQRVAGMRD